MGIQVTAPLPSRYHRVFFMEPNDNGGWNIVLNNPDVGANLRPLVNSRKVAGLSRQAKQHGNEGTAPRLPGRGHPGLLLTEIKYQDF